MKRNNQTLYNQIINNISKTVKRVLNEDMHNFDVAEYSDDEHDIVDHQTVDRLTLFAKFFNAVNNIKKLNIQGDIKHVLLPTMKIMLDVCDYKHLTNESDLEYYYDFSQVGDSLDLNEIKEFLNNNDYDFEISLIFNYDYDYYYAEFPSYSLTDIEIIYARKVIEDFISIQSLQDQYNIEKEVDNEKISVYIQGDPVYDDQCMMYLSDAFINLMVYFNKYLDYLKNKLSLNEDLQKFDVTEYDDDEHDIIDHQTVDRLTYFSEFFKAVDNIKRLNIQGDIKHVLLPKMRISLDIYDVHGKLITTSNISNINNDYYYDFSNTEDQLDFNIVTGLLNNNTYEEYVISLNFNYDYDGYYWYKYPSLKPSEIIHARKIIKDFIKPLALRKQYNIDNLIDNKNGSVYIYGYPEEGYLCTSDAFINIMIYFNKYLDYLKNKLSLNEDLQKFDVTEYDEDPDEIVDYNTIKQVNGIENVNDTLILWSDLNTYTLEDVINNIPKSGYPIGINILQNKYVSLKYMSTKNPEAGSKTHKDIIFSNKEVAEAPNVKFHEDILLSADKVKDLKVKIQNNESGVYYKSIDSKNVINMFKYFDGINQTDLILNDIKSYQPLQDYPAAECVYEFNPGETKKGDWYLPEVGELSYVYILKPVIELICFILIDMGYKDIYDRIWGVWYWSSTFYNTNAVYRILMTDGRTSDMFKRFGHDTAVLAMYAV